jgi:hypothetical protein
MSRICFGTLVFAMGLASVGFAVEPSRFSFQPYPDQSAAPVPSGLRFAETDFSVRTGNVDGGYGYGGCNSCAQGGYCAHWSLLPWYGWWEEPHHRGAHGGGRCCPNYGF